MRTTLRRSAQRCTLSNQSKFKERPDTSRDTAHAKPIVAQAMKHRNTLKPIIAQKETPTHIPTNQSRERLLTHIQPQSQRQADRQQSHPGLWPQKPPCDSVWNLLHYISLEMKEKPWDQNIGLLKRAIASIVLRRTGLFPWVLFPSAFLPGLQMS